MSSRHNDVISLDVIKMIGDFSCELLLTASLEGVMMGIMVDIGVSGNRTNPSPPDESSSPRIPPFTVHHIGEQPVGGTPPLEALLNEMSLPHESADREKARLEVERTATPINHITYRHREMMRMIVEGSTYEEVAAALGMSDRTVALIANSAIFKEEIRKLEEKLDFNVIRRAESLSNEALSKLRNIMRQTRSEARAESCADKILGIAGYSKIEKKQVAVISGEEVIRELNRQRRELFNSQNDSRTGDPPAQPV